MITYSKIIAANVVNLDINMHGLLCIYMEKLVCF